MKQKGGNTVTRGDAASEKEWQRIRNQYQTRFTTTPQFVRSPGRVNLIGEHTDYNEGFVLPAAVDKSIIFGMAANGTPTGRLYSVDKEQAFEWDIGAAAYEQSDLGWPNYIMGCVDQLRKSGYEIAGFDCAFGGTIPIGAGMSSSAALEGGTFLGLSRIFDLDLKRLTMAQLGQKAENEFVGVQCGIMDQFANVFSQAGSVFKLDCRSLEYDYFPFSRDDIHIVLCDTQVRRELASSEYNVRRRQCEQGVAHLRRYEDTIQSLRDVPLGLLQEHRAELDPVVYQRCAYVIRENQRVEQACRDLEADDFQAFGEQMYQSHAGLRDQYEVSSKELDLLVDIARDINGVLGARMMGAGFGGCTINLVLADAVGSFREIIQTRYDGQMERDVRLYQSTITEGVSMLERSEA